MYPTSGFESKLEKKINGTEKAWDKCLGPGVNVAPPFTGMAVGTRTKKNKKIGEATTNRSTPVSGGKNLSLTDMHGNGLRWNFMWFHFKQSYLSKKVNQYKNFFIMV